MLHIYTQQMFFDGTTWVCSAQILLVWNFTVIVCFCCYSFKNIICERALLWLANLFTFKMNKNFCMQCWWLEAFWFCHLICFWYRYDVMERTHKNHERGPNSCVLPQKSLRWSLLTDFTAQMSRQRERSTREAKYSKRALLTSERTAVSLYYSSIVLW